MVYCIATKAGMWHVKGLEIAINEMEEKQNPGHVGNQRMKGGGKPIEPGSIEQEFPNASLQTALESPRKLFKIILQFSSSSIQMFLIQCF